MPGIHGRAFALLAATSVWLAPAAADAAKPKKQGDYVYANHSGTTRLAVSTFGGKIGEVNGSLKIKQGGKVCPGSATGETPFHASFDPSYKVSGSGSFAFTYKRVRTATGFNGKLKVSGKFTSSSVATVKVTYSAGGCTGSLSTKKAKLQVGGGR